MFRVPHSRAAIVDRWYRLAGARLEVPYATWFDAAVVELVVAIVRDLGIAAALDRFVRARRRAGFDAAMLTTDLDAFLTALPEAYRARVSHDMVDAAAATLPPISSPSPPGDSAFVSRLREVYARSTPKIGAAVGPSLLVVEGGTASPGALAVAVGRWVPEVFPTGELVGAVGGGRQVVVVHSHAARPDPAQLLLTVLRTSPGIDTTSVTVDSVPLPDRLDHALAALAPHRAASAVAAGAVRRRRTATAGTAVAAVAAVAAIAFAVAGAVPRSVDVQRAAADRSRSSAVSTASSRARATGSSAATSASDSTAPPTSATTGRVLPSGASTTASSSQPAVDDIVLVAIGLPVDDARTMLPRGSHVVATLSAPPDPTAPAPKGRFVAVVRGPATADLCAWLASGATVEVLGDTPQCGVPVTAPDAAPPNV
jgi:hypothetical protein